jgi:hypothetical protein
VFDFVLLCSSSLTTSKSAGHSPLWLDVSIVSLYGQPSARLSPIVSDSDSELDPPRADAAPAIPSEQAANSVPTAHGTSASPPILGTSPLRQQVASGNLPFDRKLERRRRRTHTCAPLEEFSGSFDDVIRTDRIRPSVPPIKSPKANAFVERCVKTLRHEVLDWTLILGRRHLDKVLVSYAAPYNSERPHRGIELWVPQALAMSKRSRSCRRSNGTICWAA